MSGRVAQMRVRQLQSGSTWSTETVSIYASALHLNSATPVMGFSSRVRCRGFGLHRRDRTTVMA